MDRFWSQEQHLARSNHHLPVPHPSWNQARLTLPEVQRFLLGILKISSEEDVNGTFQEVQQFVLLRMHLPLVAHAGRVHREDTDMAPSSCTGRKSTDGAARMTVPGSVASTTESVSIACPTMLMLHVRR